MAKRFDLKLLIGDSGAKLVHFVHFKRHCAHPAVCKLLVLEKALAALKSLFDLVKGLHLVDPTVASVVLHGHHCLASADLFLCEAQCAVP